MFGAQASRAKMTPAALSLYCLRMKSSVPTAFALPNIGDVLSSRAAV